MLYFQLAVSEVNYNYGHGISKGLKSSFFPYISNSYNFYVEIYLEEAFVWVLHEIGISLEFKQSNDCDFCSHPFKNSDSISLKPETIFSSKFRKFNKLKEKKTEPN